MADRNQNLVEQYEPDSDGQNDAGLKSVQGDGAGNGQPRGNLRPVPPKKGVDVGGVPARPAVAPTGPGRTPIRSGGHGNGRPRGKLAPVPEPAPPAGVPNARPARPKDAPPVDTDAVGEPLSDEPADDDNRGNQRPSLRDLRREEPESEEPESEQTGKELQPTDDEDEAEDRGGEEVEETSEEEGADLAETEGAEGAGSEAGAAEAGAGAAEAGAATEGAEVAVAAGTSEIWGPIAIAVLVIIAIVAILLLIVVTGMSGAATSGGTGSSNQSGGGVNSFSGSNGFPFPKGSGFAPPSAWTLDQGVDISAPGGVPELALGDGVIVSRGIGGFGDWAPVLKLDSPIAGKYKYVYYGHAGCGKNNNGPSNAGQKNHGTPQCPEVGTRVSEGDQIAVVGFGAVGISTGPHIEIGFSDAVGNPIGGQTAPDMKAYLVSHQPQ